MDPFCCEHHRVLINDKNLLLDDENSLLMNGDCKICIHCHKETTNSVSLTASVPLFNIEEVNHWMDRKNNGPNINGTNLFSSSQLNTESRLSINSTDSMDAPLLLNVSRIRVKYCICARILDCLSLTHVLIV